MGEGCSTYKLISMLWNLGGIRVKGKKGVKGGARRGVAAREGRKKKEKVIVTRGRRSGSW